MLITMTEGKKSAALIAEVLRDAIHEGRLSTGEPLPSSRDLAKQMGVARNTLMSAIAQLVDGNLLETRPGIGTFVKSKFLLEQNLRVKEAYQFTLTDWAQRLPASTSVTTTTGAVLDLRPGTPDLQAIPFDEWRRSAVRKFKTLRNQVGSYGTPEGNADLRFRIAQYVTRSRSVFCKADDVIITSGAQQAFDLITRVLIRQHTQVAVEEPGYQPAIRAFLAGGAAISGVPVDDAGIDVNCLPDNASMVYVTPSHQYPLGVTMSDGRRTKLLSWAVKNNAFIVEDDYDSEYRYTLNSLPALQSSDTTGRVIYVGTFSKNLMPGIRLGYLVIPYMLRDVFIRAKWLVDRHSENVSQSVLAEFMSNGAFSRHIVKMRNIYEERHNMLTQFHSRISETKCRLVPSQAGLHACLLLPPSADESSLIEAAARQGVGLYGLRSTFMTSRIFPGLILGFGNTRVRELEAAMRRLMPLLHKLSV